ncbi:hypothetical protein PG995_005040 [Apiospora arundinis]
MLCGKLRVILMSAFVFNIFQTMTGWGAQASNIQDGGDINHNDGVVCMYPVPGSEYKQKLPGTPSARPRTRFGVSGCATWTYPSVGGVVYGFFTAVQLKQLGLSNMEEANRSDNDDEEDRLSRKDGKHPLRLPFPPKIYVAYPSSGKGVWVLKCSPDWRQEHDDDITKPSLPNVPESLEGRRSLALTADEGCEVLKHFGATFYESPDQCEDLPKTLDEGVQRGKRYEALLKRMEDMHYEDAWLERGSTEWPVQKV